MTSFSAICFTIVVLALPMVLGASNGQRVQVTPKKAGTNETCDADMDKNFLEELLDGIRGALGKPLPCNGEDKLCKQMECCFYKNTLPKNNTTTATRTHEEDEEEKGSGVTVKNFFNLF